MSEQDEYDEQIKKICLDFGSIFSDEASEAYLDEFESAVAVALRTQGELIAALKAERCMDHSDCNWKGCAFMVEMESTIKVQGDLIAALKAERDDWKDQTERVWREVNALRPECDPDDGWCLRCGLGWDDEKDNNDEHQCPPGFWNDNEKKIAALKADLAVERAEVERLQDKAIQFDLDQAGIASRVKESIELVEGRAEIAQLKAQLGVTNFAASRFAHEQVEREKAQGALQSQISICNDLRAALKTTEELLVKAQRAATAQPLDGDPK